MLDLFDKVEVEKVDRLNTEDLAKMKELQEGFENAKKVYYELEKIVNSIDGKNVTEYLSFVSLREDIRERLQKATKSFIENVYYHFKSKYKIDLDNKTYTEDVFRWQYTRRGHTWEEAMIYVESLHYEKIIEDIYTQTGTLNFADKGKEEFLEKCRNRIGYKMTHKNNTVSFNDLVYQDSWDANKISYSSDSNFMEMFQAINLFENDNYTLSRWADDFITNCRSHRKEYNFSTFSTHTNVPFSEIEHIKIYKNGKVDLKFTDYEVAEKFFNMFYRKG
jgi:hypothetical protein